MPAYAILTRTSPACGGSSSTSVTSQSTPTPRNTAAFDFIAVSFRCPSPLSKFGHGAGRPRSQGQVRDETAAAATKYGMDDVDQMVGLDKAALHVAVLHPVVDRTLQRLGVPGLVELGL